MNIQALLPFLLIAVLIVPMVLMSRKQKKQMHQQQELQQSLSAGDRVILVSGLYANVANTSDEATIDLEIAPGVTTTWLRGAVREKVGPDAVVENEPMPELESHAELAEPLDEKSR